MFIVQGFIYREVLRFNDHVHSSGIYISRSFNDVTIMFIVQGFIYREVYDVTIMFIVQGFIHREV